MSAWNKLAAGELESKPEVVHDYDDESDDESKVAVRAVQLDGTHAPGTPPAAAPLRPSAPRAATKQRRCVSRSSCPHPQAWCCSR